MNLFTDSPFSALTFMAAPAVLTNSCAVLLLSTSNRFARAIDRARLLGRLLAEEGPEHPARTLHLRQLTLMERRVGHLIHALTAFYVAAGCFAAGTLIALLGATLVTFEQPRLLPFALGLDLFVGAAGFCGLVFGAITLAWETRMAFAMLREEGRLVRERLYLAPPPGG